jgi:hypothetical protein
MVRHFGMASKTFDCRMMSSSSLLLLLLVVVLLSVVVSVVVVSVFGGVVHPPPCITTVLIPKGQRTRCPPLCLGNLDLLTPHHLVNPNPKDILGN